MRGREAKKLTWDKVTNHPSSGFLVTSPLAFSNGFVIAWFFCPTRFIGFGGQAKPDVSTVGFPWCQDAAGNTPLHVPDSELPHPTWDEACINKPNESKWLDHIGSSWRYYYVSICFWMLWASESLSKSIGILAHWNRDLLQGCSLRREFGMRLDPAEDRDTTWHNCAESFQRHRWQEWRGGWDKEWAVAHDMFGRKGMPSSKQIGHIES